MIRNGTGPTRIDHEDFDFHATYGNTKVSSINFPDSYNTDAGLTMPDQDTINAQFAPPVPALPYGCTDYAQSEVSTDLDGALKNPEILENYTHANENGGEDIRASLSMAKVIGWISGYFNVQSYQLDYFDSIRLAMLSGGSEKRSVTIGTPWFVEWQGYRGDIMPMPKNLTPLNQIWHNWKICGWKQINGVPMLIGKTWQGPTIGDKGFEYFPREVVNSIMTIPGTIAFTTTKGQLPPIETIPVSLMQWFVSNVKNLLGLQY